MKVGSHSLIIGAMEEWYCIYARKTLRAGVGGELIPSKDLCSLLPT